MKLLSSLVLFQHQHGLQVHQTQALSPGRNCELGALSGFPVRHPSHLPVAAQNFFAFSLQTSSAFATALLGETLDCLVGCSVKAAETCRSNTDCSGLISIQVKLPLIHVKLKPPSSNLLLILKTPKIQFWGRHRVRVKILCHPLEGQQSTMPQSTRFRGSFEVNSLQGTRWSCHCSSGECYQPGQSSSSAETKMTGLWNINQTCAGCHCSSKTFRPLLLFCHCLQQLAVDVHVLFCEK